MSGWQLSHLEKQGTFSCHLWFVWLPEKRKRVRSYNNVRTPASAGLMPPKSLFTLCDSVSSGRKSWGWWGVHGKWLHASPSEGMGNCCTWSPKNVSYPKTKRESTQEMLECNTHRQVVCVWLHSKKTMKLLLFTLLTPSLCANPNIFSNWRSSFFTIVNFKH